MLYDAWRKIARTRRSELALLDLSSGAKWTFAQLAARAESETENSPAIFPSGISSQFVFDVLRGWRNGRVVCPLDVGQKTFSFPELPKNFVHLKTTSGSTGTPQLIAFTGDQLRADAKNIVATMGLRPDWPNLGVISLAHSYGFSNLILPLLLHGIPLIFVSSRLPEAVRQAGAAFENLTLPAVPALWRVWHEAGAISKNIRLAISAGAPLPANLENEIFQRTGIKVHNFYGASECGGISYDSSTAPRESDEEVGTPMCGVKLETNAESCLRVRSEAVGETYWPVSNPSLGQGCFQTSDQVELKNGRVFLHGRQSDFINLAGKKVSPELIERAILLHPEVRECVVFSVPSEDAVRGEMIVACVSGGENLDGESLKQFLLPTIPSWQLPRRWWFLPELEGNARGKISRSQWREIFLAENKT